MDFYAMQLTPHKKKEEQERREEQLKKFREHVVTKEELLAELKPQVAYEAVSKSETETKAVKNISPDFLSSKSFSLSRKDIAVKDVEDAEFKPTKNILPLRRTEKQLKQKMSKDIWNLESSKSIEAPKKVELLAEVNEKPKAIDPIHEIETSSPIVKTHFDSVKKDASKPAIPATALDSKIETPKKPNSIFTEIKKVLPFPNVDQQVKPIATVGKSLNEKNTDISGTLEERIVKDFAEAILADDENKTNTAIEELIAFRMQDLNRTSNDHEFNIKLKEKLIGTLPALFAYKGGKSVLHVFQLLDEMNLEFSAKDFSKLPSEILKSEEMKGICQKYLLWFAKEYPNAPGKLQDRIYCFNRCEILTYKEIKGFSTLQLAIASDLVNFIKENVQDPHDVERKVYEFALAGLVDDKEFRTTQKVRDVVKKFIAALIVTKKDKPMDAAKKISEYEKIGLIKVGEVMADDKIEKAIEKYLVKFKRENHDHPRKVSVLVKDYFNAGLIDKKTRDRIL